MSSDALLSPFFPEKQMREAEQAVKTKECPMCGHGISFYTVFGWNVGTQKYDIPIIRCMHNSESLHTDNYVCSECYTNGPKHEYEGRKSRTCIIDYHFGNIWDYISNELKHTVIQQMHKEIKQECNKKDGE